MAKEPKMPEPRAVPKNPSSSEPDWDDSGKVDDIQKGMPARNIKSAFLVMALVGVLAFLFWPRDGRNSKKVQTPEPTKQNIVENLVRNSPPLEIKPVMAPILPTPVIENKKDETDERELAALLSSMSATDVVLNASAAKLKPANSIAGELKAVLDQSQARAEELRRASIAQQNAIGGGPIGVLAAQGSAELRTDERESFVGSYRGKSLVASTRLDAARRPSTLYEGTIVRVVLTRSLKTDLPGVVTAKVTTDLYDTLTQQTLLIPRGSEVNCAYQTDLRVGQELVLAACTRLRLPNGKSFSLDGTPASDLQGASGLPAEIDNHFFKMFKNALIVGAASRLLPRNDQQINVTQGELSSNVGGTILGTALNKIVDATIARNIHIPPTGSVEIGTPFTLTLSRDVELEPYSFH